mmetsp:Transcript_83708/g.122499  ORF Transcript_83708/g.122499 Transcript_83708/m.122499 type:complete len:253 (-) Transcript_83708:337-1095(-)
MDNSRLEHATRASDDICADGTWRIMLCCYMQEPFEARPAIHMPALCETGGNGRLQANRAVVATHFGNVHLADERPVHGFVRESEMDTIVLALVARNHKSVVGAEKSILVKLHNRPSASKWKRPRARVTLSLGRSKIEQESSILTSALLRSRRRRAQANRRSLNRVNHAVRRRLAHRLLLAAAVATPLLLSPLSRRDFALLLHGSARRRHLVAVTTENRKAWCLRTTIPLLYSNPPGAPTVWGDQLSNCLGSF